jgi:hypothetical protein
MEGMKAIGGNQETFNLKLGVIRIEKSPSSSANSPVLKD